MTKYNPILLALNANALTMIYGLLEFVSVPWGASIKPGGSLTLIFLFSVPAFLVISGIAIREFRKNRSLAILLTSLILSACPLFSGYLSVALSMSIREITLR